MRPLCFLYLALCTFIFTSFVPLPVSAQYIFDSFLATAGSGNGEVMRAFDIAIAPGGKFYISEIGNDRIQILDNSGNYESDFPVSNPKGIALDASGLIYTISGNAIEIYNSSGVLQNTISGGFSSPNFLRIDGSDNIYIGDSFNHRICKYDSGYNLDFCFGVNGTGDGELNTPVGINLRSNGDIIVCDQGNARVQIFDSNGNYLSA